AATDPEYSDRSRTSGGCSATGSGYHQYTEFVSGWWLRSDSKQLVWRQDPQRYRWCGDLIALPQHDGRGKSSRSQNSEGAIDSDNAFAGTGYRSGRQEFGSGSRDRAASRVIRS